MRRPTSSAACRSTTRRARPLDPAAPSDETPLVPLRYLAGLDSEGPARHQDDGRSTATSRSGAWATTRRRRAWAASTGP